MDKSHAEPAWTPSICDGAARRLSRGRSASPEYATTEPARRSRSVDAEAARSVIREMIDRLASVYNTPIPAASTCRAIPARLMNLCSDVPAPTRSRSDPT